MKGFDKNKRQALVLTILFHLLVLVALFLMALRTPLPLPGEEGVEVNLGYSDLGMGIQQSDDPPQYAEPMTQAPSPQEAVKEESLATDDTDIALAEQPKPQQEPTSQQESSKPVEETVQKPQETQATQPQLNPRALYKGSSANTSNSNEGITGQAGDQGMPEGLRDVTRYDGRGGQGDGPSYYLGGRGSKNLAIPKSAFKEQGNVVVDIWVDRKGNVVRAEVNLRGTTILDQNLRSLAVQAALNSVFVEDPAAAEQQKGSITYTFIIGN